MSGYAAPCCCSGRTCGGTYYILFPTCGSMPTSQCQRMLIQDATNNGLSKFDFIKRTGASAANDDCYQLRCPEDPLPECGGFGPDVMCQDPDEPNQNFTTVAANLYTKAASNNCTSCAPDDATFPTCSTKFADCVGIYIDSTNSTTTPAEFKCLKIASSGFSYTGTSSRYPQFQLTISSVTVHPDTGYTGSGLYSNLGDLRLILEVDYSYTQTAESCCDLPPSDPNYCGGFGSTGCCHDLSCTGGTDFIVVVADFNNNDQRVRMQDPTSSPFLLPSEYQVTQDSCGGILSVDFASVTRGSNFSDPNNCLPCSTFAWSGTIASHLQIPSISNSCKDGTQNGFPFSINFAITTDAP